MAHNPIQLMIRKLKCLQFSLKTWNRDTLKNIYVEMEEASEALNSIQAEIAMMGDTDDRFISGVDCTVHLNSVLARHQAQATQKNHLQWL
ncbi:hypothetical protein ACS0TY_035048 [Phlomoides rotata]